MRKIELFIPLENEAIISVRLVAGSLATYMQANIELVEDIKLLASEGCNILRMKNFQDCRIVFEYEDGFKMHFYAQNQIKNTKAEEILISKMIIDALAKSKFNLSKGEISIEVEF